MKERTIVGLGTVAAALLAAAAWSACTPVVRTIGGSGGQGGGTSSSTGGHGGSGGTAGCTPGDKIDCYDGPPATQGVGQCVPGKALCGNDGKPGACVGQVLPAATVDCKAHQDQDCDGVPDRCALDFIWGHGYTPTDGQDNVFRSGAVDASGNVFLVGTLDGSVDFGNGALTSAGGDDALLVKLAPDGTTLFARQFGDSGSQEATGVALDTAGNPYVGGSYEGTMNLGSFIMPASAGARDVYVVKLDKTGTPQWQRSGGDADDQRVTAVAATPAGGVVAVGTFYGTLAWNGGTAPTFIATPTNSQNVFVQRFNGNGISVFGMATTAVAPDGGGYGYQEAMAVAIDGNGDVIVAGDFSGTINFPNGQAYTAVGNSDVFVAKLNGKDGSVLWVQTFGGDGDDIARSVAVDSKGSIVVSGVFSTSITIGTTVVTTVGDQGMFLARLGGDGSVGWARGFGTNSVAGLFVHPDETDDLVLYGYCNGTVSFGGDLLDTGVPVGQFGAAFFVAKLDPAGAHIASRMFGVGGFGVYFAGATIPLKNTIMVAGATINPVDLGDGTMVGAPMLAAPIVAEYAP